MPQSDSQSFKTLLDHARKHDARMVDVKFADVSGAWRHFTVSVAQLSESSVREGFVFEGSLTRDGAKERLVAIPDMSTAFVDPFCAVPTLSLTASIARGEAKEIHSLDVRSIAARAEKFLLRSGFADVAEFGARPEFFIFDNVQFDQKSNGCFYSVDSEEASWNSSREEMPNLGYKVRRAEGLFAALPGDTQQDIRTEMCVLMEQLGIRVLRHHHETSTAGHGSIEIAPGTLLKSADALMLSRYVIKNTARRHGKTATFMPAPLFGEARCGMSTTLSMQKKSKALFSSDKHGEATLHFISGIRKHAKSLCAFTNPTTNSYRRLASIAPVGKPTYLVRDARFEYLVPDSAANVYLTFAALLLAGFDGVANQIEVSGKDFSLPNSLAEAIDALKADHAFLLQGGVFTEEFLDAWVRQKCDELETLQARPHPYEFQLYYDV